MMNSRAAGPAEAATKSFGLFSKSTSSASSIWRSCSRKATLFRGLEQYPDLLTDPRSLRASYLEQFGNFVQALQSGCRAQNIDYVQLRTDTPLNVALSSYLGHRLNRSR